MPGAQLSLPASVFATSGIHQARLWDIMGMNAKRPQSKQGWVLRTYLSKPAPSARALAQMEAPRPERSSSLPGGEVRGWTPARLPQDRKGPVMVTGSSEHDPHRPLNSHWMLLFSQMSEILSFEEKMNNPIRTGELAQSWGACLTYARPRVPSTA